LLNQFDAPRLDDLGLEDETARSPLPLLRQADRIARAFQGENLAELLGQSVFTQPIDVRSQAADLAPHAAALRTMVVQFDEARARLAARRIERKTTLKEHDQIFLRTARSFEDFCRLVGENELADKVRPSRRRPGRVEQQTEIESDGDANTTVTRDR
ncbi:MAG: hypothetical protein AAF657_31780, partial [Acidobacteriota bacterium]